MLGHFSGGLATTLIQIFPDIGLDMIQFDPVLIPGTSLIINTNDNLCSQMSIGRSLRTEGDFSN